MRHSYHMKELTQMYDEDYVTWNNRRKHEEHYKKMVLNYGVQRIENLCTMVCTVLTRQ